MGSGLDWAWKPPANEVPERFRLDREQRRRQHQRRKRKRGLCYAPSEVFYESKPWKALRRKVLATYGYKCMKCCAVDTEIHVDHIVPRSKAPKLSLKFRNLQVLCRACNMEKRHYHSTDYREEAIARELDLEAARAARQFI